MKTKQQATQTLERKAKTYLDSVFSSLANDQVQALQSYERSAFPPHGSVEELN